MADPSNALALPPYEMPGSQPLSAAPPTNHFSAALRGLQMSPQEQALYMRHLMNLYGSGGVDNEDGSRSTLYTANMGIGDKAYNLPTVYNGAILPPDASVVDRRPTAIGNALSQGLDKFPSYQSPFEAENRYTQMHNYMDRDTADYMATKGRR